MNAFISSWKGNPEWKQVGRHCASQCIELFWDGAIWLTGIFVLGVANLAIGLMHLPPRAAEMMEAIHLNTVYATILVASASAISRLVVASLERLGHWGQSQEQ